MAENDNEKSSGDAGRDPRLLYVEEEQENGIFRWMSAMVVLLAVAGFFGLAWYAYKSGGEAVDEKDVELVKADKAPVKEAPANPGGMQIPNQDKTVYGLISGAKPEKPTVERILPAPEEPVARGGDTETWMSDKAKNKVSGEEGTEKMAEAAPVTPPTPPTASVETVPSQAKKAEQFNPAQAKTAAADHDDVAPQEVKPKPDVAVATPVAPKPAVVTAPPVAPAPKPEAKKEAAPVAPAEEASPEEKSSPAPAAPEAVTKPEAKPPAKGARVQLGAYKSEAEAKANWEKIAKKFASEMNGKEHYIVRADLGEKGVYYRLQAAPFKSAGEAEEFCLTIVSAGQNCIAKAK